MRKRLLMCSEFLVLGLLVSAMALAGEGAGKPEVARTPAKENSGAGPFCAKLPQIGRTEAKTVCFGEAGFRDLNPIAIDFAGVPLESQRQYKHILEEMRNCFDAGAAGKGPRSCVDTKENLPASFLFQAVRELRDTQGRADSADSVFSSGAAGPLAPVLEKLGVDSVRCTASARQKSVEASDLKKCVFVPQASSGRQKATVSGRKGAKPGSSGAGAGSGAGAESDAVRAPSSKHE